MSVDKTLNEMPSCLCGRLLTGTGSLPVVVAQSNGRLAKRANGKLLEKNERSCPCEEEVCACNVDVVIT